MSTVTTPEELKALEKQVRKTKRIASEWACQMHDLAEERLPEAHDEIHSIAQGTYEACKAWADAEAKLKAAQAEAS